MKTDGEAPGVLLFLSVWSPLMKHDKRVFELASQTSICNIRCMFATLICMCNLGNVTQITSDFPTGFSLGMKMHACDAVCIRGLAIVVMNY